MRQFELKIKPMNIAPQHIFDVDLCIMHLGLDPAAIRESASRTGSSLAEVISVILGIEPKEFVRLLKEKINHTR